MVICPIALAVGCRNCPAFSVCPVKSVIGDFKPNVRDDAQARAPAAKPAKPASTRTKAKAGSNRRGARARRPRK